MTLDARARLIFPSEHHVDRNGMANDEGHAETRTRLFERLRDTFMRDVSIASPAELRVLLEGVLTELASSNPLLMAMKKTGQMSWLLAVDAIFEATGALHTAGVSVEALEKNRTTRDLPRVKMMREVMTHLSARLADANLLDPRLAGFALAKKIEAAAPSDVLAAVGAPRVLARWVFAWDPADVAWWRAVNDALGKVGGSLTVELPAINRRLDAAREESPLEMIADVLTEALEEPPEFVLTEDEYGALSETGEARDIARIEIVSGTNAIAQARAVVSMVRHALLAGVPLDAIAVGASELTKETLEPLRRMFTEAGIVTHDRARKDGQSGLVTLALAALRLSSLGLHRGEVAALLRSPYVKPSLPDAEPLTRGALEDLARAFERTASARGGSWAEAFAQTAHDSSQNEEERARRFALGAQLAEILSVDQTSTREEYIGRARAMWSALGLAPTFPPALSSALASDDTFSALSRAELHTYARDCNGWNQLLGTLESWELGRVNAREKTAAIDINTFLHELETALAAADPAPPAGAAGSVRIATLRELAGCKLELLIVFDANDGVLPRTRPIAPFASDALGPNKAARLAELRSSRSFAEFAMAASRAKNLGIAYRQEGDDGSLLAPSSIVASLKRAGVKERSFRASPLASGPLSEDEALVSAIAQNPRAALSLNADVARRAERERERETMFESQTPRLTPLRGALAPSADRTRILTEETGGGSRALSITGLERMATCSFQGFASQVLRARDAEAVSDAPDPSEIGTLVHGALALALQATLPLWSQRPRDKEAIVAGGLAAADTFFAQQTRASVSRRLTLERARADVKAVLLFSIADEIWDFAFAEKTFGDGAPGSWPPIVLASEGDSGPITLRGSIDRVDIEHGGRSVRAIDYKTSARAAQLAGAHLGETTFQIAFYARVASEALGAAHREGLYLPARARALPENFRRPRKHDETWANAHEEDEQGRTRVERRARHVVENLRGGNLAPLPIDDSACETCSFDGGCRKPRFAIRGAEDDESDGGQSR